MERTLSVEEKIRKAEEIYNKRKNPNARTESETINIKPNSFVTRKMKKLFIQLSICIIIYVILYSTDFGRVIFSENSSNYIKTILATDVDFNAVYKNVNEYIQSIIPKEENDEINNGNNIEENSIFQTNNSQIDTENTVESNNNVDANLIVQTDNSAELVMQEVNEEINIGGAIEIEESIDVSEEEQKTQMEIDAEYILSKINFIKPINSYEISSRYGLRNPTTSTVPKNHKGIDLATETGTKIVSATDGTVILASSQGDYGKHLKIQIDDIVIVYAHCNKLYVKEGEQISIGQEIAEVGSSGNSTGPHLHFEIRLDNRTIDPEYILDFS